MAANAVTADITGANEFSASISPKTQTSFGIENTGYLNVSISGTFTATVSLQRSFDGGTTWRTRTTYTTATETNVFDHEARVLYRLGVETGNFTSGTVSVRLGA